MTEKNGAIYEAMFSIASEMPSISKEGRNVAQGYSFRGVDQVFNSLQPIFAKHGVFITTEIIDLHRDERPSKSGGIMAFVTVRARYHFVARDGSSVSTESVGEGCDTSDKATPKALSISLKYALLETFLVPTSDTKDPEVDSHELMTKPVAQVTKPVVHESKPVGQPVPMTEAHANELVDLIMQYQEVSGIDDVRMSNAIADKLEKKYQIRPKGLSGLHDYQAIGLIKVMKGWIDIAAKKKADELAKAAGPSPKTQAQIDDMTDKVRGKAAAQAAAEATSGAPGPADPGEAPTNAV